MTTRKMISFILDGVALLCLATFASLILSSCSSGTALQEKYRYNVALALADSANQLKAFGEYMDSNGIFTSEKCLDIGIGIFGARDFMECTATGQHSKAADAELWAPIRRTQAEQKRNHPRGVPECLDSAFKATARYVVAHDTYLQDDFVVSEIIPIFMERYQTVYREFPSILVVSKWNKDGTVCRSRVGVMQR